MATVFTNIKIHLEDIIMPGDTECLREKNMTRAKRSTIAVGIVSIVVAAVGFWYNMTTLLVDFSGFERDHSIPYFYHAFYAMSAICIVCYAVLLICGVQFVRLRTGLLKIFVGVVIFEVVYFLSLGPVSLVPRIGMSVGAAVGVANGGLMFQAVILFPLWAPLLARRAARELSHDRAPSQ